MLPELSQIPPCESDGCFLKLVHYVESSASRQRSCCSLPRAVDNSIFLRWDSHLSWITLKPNLQARADVGLL